MKRFFVASAALAFLLGGTLQAKADTINVLWYTGGVESTGPGTYEANLSKLAAQSLVAPISVHNTLNITFWNGTGPVPVGSYNTMVVASPEGGWSSYPSYTSLQNALNSGALKINGRVMVTGQDADWHYQFGPGPTNFNGPQGFLIDAINWSGSGSGMGVVFLGGTDGITTAALNGLGIQNSIGDNTVNIPAAYATFPINEGLTSAGLSNWSTSAHTSWSGFTSAWTAINVGGSSEAVTLVDTADVGGGTTASPEPTSLALLGLGAAGLMGYRWRRQRAQATPATV